eukprot:7113446-Prymnesium_polylepis.1
MWRVWGVEKARAETWRGERSADRLIGFHATTKIQMRHRRPAVPRLATKAVPTTVPRPAVFNALSICPLNGTVRLQRGGAWGGRSPPLLG